MNCDSSCLRILQVNSLFSGGGTDNQTLELVAGLQDRGHRVSLAVPAGSRWESVARGLGLNVACIPVGNPKKFVLIKSWAGIIRRQRIQILHAHQGRDYWPAIAAARLAGQRTKVVVTRHLMTRPRTFSRWFLLSMADVVAVSQAVETVLRRELRGPVSRLHRIYGGIDITRFEADRSGAAQAFRASRGWPATAVVFGVVGAFNYPRGKGQVEFLAAASQLKTVLPLSRFAIIGAGTMETALHEEIAAQGLGAVAVILPFTEDIPLVMNAIDVLVHPAVGTEALGLVLWEAMASGRPVIALRLDGIPEAFRENEHGLLVPPGDVPSLAAAMRFLIERPELRRQWGLAGRDYVRQNFSRAAQALRMEELYLSLCTENG
jgi:glycosyltransferase involved in cell wall biosynthesis